MKIICERISGPLHKTYSSASFSTPLAIFSSERHYVGAPFLYGILSAVEESLMQIRGAVVLLTIALKGNPGWRGIQTRGRMESGVYASAA